MKKPRIKILILLGWTILFLSSCQKMSFVDDSSQQMKSLEDNYDDPILPPVPVDPTPTPEAITPSPSPLVISSPTLSPTATLPPIIRPTVTPTVTPVITLRPTVTPSATPRPTITPTPTVNVVPPSLKTGACNVGQAISSCLTCQGPVLPTPTPKILSKAEKLAKIVAQACTVRNKSDPPSYNNPPSEKDILNRLQACTEDAYPETPTTNQQKNTLDMLINPDSNLKHKIYSSLWYNPPFTDDFELYFGLETQESRHLFCYNDKGLSGILVTTEYTLRCLQVENCTDWQNDRAAVARFNAAQKIRQQLITCLNNSSDLIINPPPTPPPLNCKYKSFEGLNELGGRDFATQLLNQNYTLALETGVSCTQIKTLSQLNALLLKRTGLVKITGFICQ